ncbi:hypothetical protein [Caulobacter sp. NIBR1757]|uniref:hypothetical protein n=1 Tax=Caulobacter sp. NIBR1757 TaxID=3016000 RepID=UPI0022F0B559|nr:hypothetical protein [Caulobacter sp. NIBR1757]WGM39367.1 hypothetical protein AMEJIAPC_02286 [Caulobacter sp. NIBR1757]
MRIVTLAAIAAFGLAAPALAAEPQVTVTYGPKLEKKIDEYGVRDVDRLAEDLRRSVLKEAARTPALDDARIELVLEDAVPNRPTFQQMSDKPGLSYESFGVGGAAISGRVTLADGTTRSVSYRWYETDIRWAWPSGTWSDAEQTFDRFASRLARNKDL